MRRFTNFSPLLLCLLLLLSISPLLAQETGKFLKPPEVMKVFEDGSALRFISTDNAFLPSGELNTEVFSPASSMYNNLLSRTEEDGCIRLRVVDSADGHSIWQKDYQDALARTQDIFIARVLRVHPGFLGEKLGSLLVLEQEETLKGASKSKHFLVFYGAASFLLGDRKVCQTAGEYGPLPEIGDRLMIFNRPRYHQDEIPFLFTGPADLIVLKKDQTLQLPTFYRFPQRIEVDKSALRADQFVAWTRGLLEEKAQ